VINDQTVCQGSSLTVPNTVGGLAGTYSQVGTSPSVLTFTLSGLNTIISGFTSTASPYSVQFTTTAGGCRDTAQVTVNAKPVINDQTVCQGSSLTVPNTVGGLAGTYSQVGTSPSVLTFTLSGLNTIISGFTSTASPYSVQFTTTAGGCRDTAQVTVNAKPVINDQTVCQGSSLTVPNTVGGLAGTYSQVGTSPSVLTFTLSGLNTIISGFTSTASPYSVQFTTTAGGCKDTAQVTVNAKPVINDQTVCQGSSLTVPNTVGGLAGTYSQVGTSPSVLTFTLSGLNTIISGFTSTASPYSVQFTTTAGGCRDTAQVTVNAKPVINDQTVCQGSSLTVPNTVGGLAGTYSQVGTSPSVLTFTLSGLNTIISGFTSTASPYSVQFTTTAGGCRDTAQVTVNAKPVINDQTVCQGSSLTVPNTVGGLAGTYSQVGTSPSVLTFTLSGLNTIISGFTSTASPYSVQFTTTAGGCRDTAQVTVNAKPVINDQTVCQGSSLTVPNTVGGLAGTYSQVGTSPSVLTFTLSGLNTIISGFTSTASPYSVQFTTTAGGCKDTITGYGKC
jgi:hypothetical protein